MSNYTNEEARQVIQMMKDLATIKQAHPVTEPWIDSATDSLKDLRDFIADMVSEEE